MHYNLGSYSYMHCFIPALQDQFVDHASKGNVSDSVEIHQVTNDFDRVVYSRIIPQQVPTTNGNKTSGH